MWQLKWELEDLSLRYLEPEPYKKVDGLLDERRVDRERYIEEVIARLRQALAEVGIEAEVTVRPKHVHSIINKMKRKLVGFSELYDVRALRVLVGDIQNCYAALSVVHDLWPPIAGEFDDYIANPKGNGYGSELGVATHWRYKENKKPETGFDDKLAWLRQMLACKA